MRFQEVLAGHWCVDMQRRRRREYPYMDTDRNESRRAGTIIYWFAAVLYALICVVRYASAARANRGRFVYPLDDTFRRWRPIME